MGGFDISTEWRPNGVFVIRSGIFGPRIYIEEFRKIGRCVDGQQRWSDVEQIRYRKISNKEIAKARIFDKCGKLF